MEHKKSDAPPLNDGASQTIPNNGFADNKDTETAKDSKAEAPRNKILWSIEEIIALSGTEQKFLLQNYLPMTGLAALVGKPDIGKSQFARHLAIEIASGSETFLGLGLKTNHKRVLYVITEDAPEAVGYALAKQRKALSISAGVNLNFLSAGALETNEIERRIRMELQLRPADIVIIDSFGDIFEAPDLNNNASMRHALRPYNSIADEYKCLVLFLHHITKSSSDKFHE